MWGDTMTCARRAVNILKVSHMNALLYAISPIHVTTSLSALLSLHGNDPLQATILVHWPGVDQEVVREIEEIVRVMSGEFNFVQRVVSISSAQKQAMLSARTRADSLRLLKERLGQSTFDEVYYAHDIEGGMQQFLCTAYAEARRVCFGDAMGFVFEKETLLSYYDDPAGATPGILPALRKAAANALKVLKKLLSGGEQRNGRGERGAQLTFDEFAPHEAALVIPVDQSGNFLRGIPLTVCSKELVLNIVGRCAASCHELQTYINGLLDCYQGQEMFLLLTENNAEGNFIDFDREIEMYCAVVTAHCKAGGVVFLKSHPGETLPRNQRLRERLEGAFEVVELDKRYRRYPIEIWKDLVLAATIICMSSPMLTLKYLYGIDVIQPMDEIFIESWFKEWIWRHHKIGITLYMEPLQKLPAWDGTGVLWAGPNKRLTRSIQ